MNNELTVNNEINLKNNIQEVSYEGQKNFLETTWGQIVNGGINIGLRALLPDFLEDEIIQVKDSIVTDGFKAGMKTAIDNAIDLGKSFLGIFTGKFENMSQIKDVIKKGKLIDGISEVLDWGIDMANENNLISKSTSRAIKKGKNTMLNNISSNIEENTNLQIESIEKIEKYTEKWNKYFNNKDFSNMEKQYEKIEKELETIIPLEDVIIKARQVENLHNLIKNNGQNFNLSKEELELAKKLA